jgi:aminopeptidase
MRDPRRVQLAKTIVRHSCRLQAGETILIESFDLTDGLIHEIIDEAYAVGGNPQVYLRRTTLVRQMLRHGNEAQFQKLGEIELAQMKHRNYPRAWSRWFRSWWTWPTRWRMRSRIW